jgi:D-alanyl-D-alanine carboxypeptidase/D-alanyl-D-alanine-endopeptidase (penicillin-binding protein 4)
VSPHEAKPILRGLSIGLWGRHDLYVQSLAALLASQGANAHVIDDAGAALGRIQIARVGVLLAESPLPSELEGLASLGPPVIVLSERSGEDEAASAGALGAYSLHNKDGSLSALVRMIRAAIEDVAPTQGLTRRQRQVLELIAEGMDNAEIAEKLGITQRTARAHVSAVLERLGADNRTQAAVMALRKGWIGLLALVALVAPALAQPSPADAAISRAQIASSLAARLAPVSYGTSAWVVDADSEDELYALNADRKRSPASVQKLFTSATALDRLGEQHRFRTIVAANTAPDLDGVLKGSLYLKGAGDPSFGTSALGRLASRLRDAQLSDVTGRVLGDESYFDSRRGLPAANFRLSTWVGPLSALAFNEGTLYGFGRGFQLTPPLFVAQRLRKALAARGVDVARAARIGLTPLEAVELASVRSAPLSALVKHMNQASDNFYAETLLKALGAGFAGAGSTSAGASVVRRFEREIGVSTRVLDGSGLSRGDAASARAVGKLLLRVRERPWFQSFYRSLPVAGRTGTLHDRMRRTAARGACRAKTGTLIGVSALAGYCRSRRGHRIVFALLMNGVGLTSAHAAQDRVAAALARYAG